MADIGAIAGSAKCVFFQSILLLFFAFFASLR